MRELKFRAWDKGTKQWIHEPVMFYVQNHKPFASTLHIHEQIDSVLMQFTGLLDKNGKEIYEGDIVEAYNGNSEVWFQDGSFMVSIGEGYIEMSQDSNSNLYGVIGNIYQNPELLK